MAVEEPVHAYQKKLYTIQKYLKMENEALEKHEFYKGEIFAMSGEGNKHNITYKCDCMSWEISERKRLPPLWQRYEN